MAETFWGRFVEPFHRRRSRKDILETPKFYLFDCGVSSFLAGRTITEPKGEAFGRAFEQFIFHELSAYSSYSGKDFAIRYWRTKKGVEVDFVLGEGEVAVEVKGSGWVGSRDLNSLKSFVEEFRPRAAFLVCQETRERAVGELRVVPWRLFLERLWAGEVI